MATTSFELTNNKSKGTMQLNVLFKYFVFLFCLLHGFEDANSALHPSQKRKKLNEAMHFLRSIQNPSDCKGQKYTVVTYGVAGGFAAQFQLAASEFMRTLASTDFSMPVLIKGHIMGYSDGKECAHVNYDWTCYFEPISHCQEDLLKTGVKVDPPGFSGDDDAAIPKAFQSLGSAFWWGVIQHFLFHPRPFVQHYIQLQMESMQKLHYLNQQAYSSDVTDERSSTKAKQDTGSHLAASNSPLTHHPHAHATRSVIYPFAHYQHSPLPMIGMHVRHGDKHVDGFIEHSLEDELEIIKQSVDCAFFHPILQQCYLGWEGYLYAHVVIAPGTSTSAGPPSTGGAGGAGGNHHTHLHHPTDTAGHTYSMEHLHNIVSNLHTSLHHHTPTSHAEMATKAPNILTMHDEQHDITFYSRLFLHEHIPILHQAILKQWKVIEETTTTTTQSEAQQQTNEEKAMKQTRQEKERLRQNQALFRSYLYAPEQVGDRLNGFRAMISNLTTQLQADEDAGATATVIPNERRRRLDSSRRRLTEIVSSSYVPLTSFDEQAMVDILQASILQEMQQNANHYLATSTEQEQDQQDKTSRLTETMFYSQEYDLTLLPVPIFVASDDSHVHIAAWKRGFFVSEVEVSQQTANDGMLKTLLSHPEYGYNATLEIFRDIWILSHCSTLLGVASSQVFRMAVAMANVTGKLHHVKIMDKNQLNKVKGLSKKYHIPFPEQFD